MKRISMVLLALALSVGAGAGNGADIRGRVRDAAGRPMPGARARLLYVHDSSGYGSRWLAQTRTDAKGEFRLALPKIEYPRFAVGTPALRVYLVVDAPGSAPSVETVRPDAAARYTVTLEKARQVVCRVVDARGRPVAAAEVVVSHVFGGVGARASGDVVRELYREQTRGDGRAFFGQAPAGARMYLRARHAEAGFGVTRVMPLDGAARIQLSHEGVAAKGRAVDAATGRPVAGMIVARAGGGGWSVTDDLGAYAVARGGSPKRRAGRGGAREFVLIRDPRPVPEYAVNWAPAAAKGVEAKLRPGALISGVARDTGTGKPAAGVGVSLSLRLAGGRHVIVHRVTGADGRYAFRAEGKKARVGVRTPPPGYHIVRSPSWVRVSLSGDRARADLPVRLCAEALLRLRALYPNGKPAAGARVRVGQKARRSTADAALTDEAGEATVRGLEPSGAVGLYAVSADSRFAAWVEIESGAARTREPLVIRLRPAGVAAVVFRDEDGRAVKRFLHAFVSLSTPGRSKFRGLVISQVRRDRGAGALRFAGLLPDVEYQARGYVRGSTWRGVCNATWRFAAGEKSPRIELNLRNVKRVKKRKLPPDAKELAAAQLRTYAAEARALDGSQWRRRDPFDQRLTWHGESLALVDSSKREVKRFDGLFGYRRCRAAGIAFTQDRVYVATDKGMFVWDRKGGFWNRFPVGGRYVEAPVTEFKASAGKWRVTIEPKRGKRIRFEYAPKTGRWKRL